jgi:hypothetical protein
MSLTHRDLHAILGGYDLPNTYQATIETDTGPDPEGAPTMSNSTYAVYGVTDAGKRQYIGGFDTKEHAERIAERWIEEYPKVVVSFDTLTDDAIWESIETVFTS